MIVKYFYHSSNFYYGNEAGWVECTKEQYDFLKYALPNCPLKIEIKK
jgi:hypothetical protein